MSNFANKIVFITGATSGIGKACAEQFSAIGAKLIITGRRLDRLEQLRDELDTDAQILNFDVCDREAVNTAIVNLPPEWQAIDVLVNNAGLAAGLDTIVDADPNDWDQMIDTNIKGLLSVTQAILPGMLERQRGHVLNISSIAGLEVYPKGNVYCATKFAVRALSQGLKMDCHGSPIRVTDIAPGAVETEFSNVRFKQDTQKADSVYHGFQPLAADDIANAVVYAATRPAHVDIRELVITPTAQSAATMIHRDI
tara:strand:+ start:54023 stop:54784 length:762 start_codon:yes stop_codon:yes gene_type:complete